MRALRPCVFRVAGDPTEFLRSNPEIALAVAALLARRLHMITTYLIDLKRQFDDLRMQMGNVSPRTWITLALNEWIGRPSGVSDLGPGARK